MNERTRVAFSECLFTLVWFVCSKTCFGIYCHPEQQIVSHGFQRSLQTAASLPQQMLSESWSVLFLLLKDENLDVQNK